MTFPISKKKKYNLTQKAGELPLGSKGIIVSYAIGNYRKDAIREILNILTIQNSDNTKTQDLELEIEKIRYEMPRFVPMSELSRGLTFIEFKNKDDLPNHIVKNIFENASKYSCRFISKIIPIEIICSAKINVLTESLKGFVAKEFPYSKVSGNQDKICDHKPTWALIYNRTHSNEANKKLVLDLLDDFIGNSYKVSLENPDKMIIFHVVKSSCGFGCVENYSSTCKLNLHKLCQKFSRMVDVPEVPNGPWEHNHGDWFCNDTKEWLYNPKDSTYFHVPTSTTIVKQLQKEYDDDNDIGINLQNDLIADTFTDTGSDLGNSLNKNKFITLDSLQIGIIANCGALCYYSGLFCGHGGSECPEYIVKHLKNNILTVFRQSYPVIMEKNQSLSKRKLKRKEGRESSEIQALEISCIKGFQMTDNNYLNYAKRNHKKDGSAASVSLFYGPTEEGQLKLITANIGDSHVILSRHGSPIRLSCEHKPNDENEHKRIKKAGGIIQNINGTWKVLKGVKNVSNKLDNQGLSISRSFGDYDMKYPQKLISSEPHISIVSIDFDNDDFLVLVSSGIADLINDQQIVNIIADKIKKNCPPKESSKAIIDHVRMKGLVNDATCTVIYFGWRNIFKNDIVKDEGVEIGSDGNDDDGEDECIDIFK